MKKISFLFIVFLIPFITTSQALQKIDEIAPFSEGLAGVRKGDSWGFINTEGDLVIDFRNDLVWNGETVRTKSGVQSIEYPRFKNGRCMIKEMLEEEQIEVYGFIDTKGDVLITPEYLNLTEFDDEYALGILLTKTFRGKNRFQLNIYEYKFSEVFLNTEGEIMLLVTQRDNILMDKRRYEIPELRAKYLSSNLMAVKTDKNSWDLRKTNF